MHLLSSIDYALIILYFIGLIMLGLYLKRRAGQSIENYFLAGRNLPWWCIGISGMGWSLDITGTMLITSLLYLLGPRGLFIEFRGGVPLGLVFVMAWTGKWHRRSNCMTGAEWQVYRFGEKFGGKCARIISAVAGIVFSIGMLAYMARGVGLFFSMFIPQLTPLHCSIIVLTIATIYTISSGFYGVVYSDIFQAIMVFLGVAVVTVMAWNRVEGFNELSNLASSVTGSEHWTTSFPQTATHMPVGYEMYESLFMFVVFLVLRNIVTGLGTGNTPQYFAAKSERDCGKIAAVWPTLLSFRWFMMISYAILGLYLIQDIFPDMTTFSQAAAAVHEAVPSVTEAQWPNVISRIANNPAGYPELSGQLSSVMGDEWTSTLQFVSYHGTINAERILPAVLLYSIPPGITGLILVTLMAASMSTFDSTMNLAAALFTRDIYQGTIRPKAKTKELLLATYIFCIAMAVVGFIMGYFARSINDIWGWIMMGLITGLAVPTVLRLYWWRFNGEGFAIGTFFGMAAAVIQRLIWPDLPEQMQFIILLAISLVFTVAGTYLTKPADEKTLQHFYLTTRPFGFWGPYKDLLNPQMKKSVYREHKYDLLSVPFIFMWMVTMYLLPMQFMIRNYRDFGITAVIFLLSVAGIYRFWYKGNLAVLPDAGYQQAFDRVKAHSPEPRESVLDGVS